MPHLHESQRLTVSPLIVSGTRFTEGGLAKRVDSGKISAAALLRAFECHRRGTSRTPRNSDQYGATAHGNGEVGHPL